MSLPVFLTIARVAYEVAKETINEKPKEEKTGAVVESQFVKKDTTSAVGDSFSSSATSVVPQKEGASVVNNSSSPVVMSNAEVPQKEGTSVVDNSFSSTVSARSEKNNTIVHSNPFGKTGTFSQSGEPTLKNESIEAIPLEKDGKVVENSLKQEDGTLTADVSNVSTSAEQNLIEASLVNKEPGLVPNKQPVQNSDAKIVEDSNKTDKKRGWGKYINKLSKFLSKISDKIQEKKAEAEASKNTTSAQVNEDGLGEKSSKSPLSSITGKSQVVEETSVKNTFLSDLSEKPTTREVVNSKNENSNPFEALKNSSNEVSETQSSKPSVADLSSNRSEKTEIPELPEVEQSSEVSQSLDSSTSSLSSDLSESTDPTLSDTNAGLDSSITAVSSDSLSVTKEMNSFTNNEKLIDVSSLSVEQLEKMRYIPTEREALTWLSEGKISAKTVVAKGYSNFLKRNFYNLGKDQQFWALFSMDNDTLLDMCKDGKVPKYLEDIVLERCTNPNVDLSFANSLAKTISSKELIALMRMAESPKAREIYRDNLQKRFPDVYEKFQQEQLAKKA